MGGLQVFSGGYHTSNVAAAANSSSSRLPPFLALHCTPYDHISGRHDGPVDYPLNGLEDDCFGCKNIHDSGIEVPGNTPYIVVGKEGGGVLFQAWKI